MAEENDSSKRTPLYRFWFGPKLALHNANWTVVITILLVAFLAVSLVYHLIVDPM